MKDPENDTTWERIACLGCTHSAQAHLDGVGCCDGKAEQGDCPCGKSSGEIVAESYETVCRDNDRQWGEDLDALARCQYKLRTIRGLIIKIDGRDLIAQKILAIIDLGSEKPT